MGARKDLALRSIRSKFADWRRSKKHGDPVPDVLWDEMHALEKRIGRTRLALDLGLNSSDVAFQMNLRQGTAPGSSPSAGPAMPPQKPAPAFLSSPGMGTQTVAITKVVSVPLSASPSRGGAAVEIESPSGWILRLQPEASPDFVRAFVEATGRIGGRE